MAKDIKDAMQVLVNLITPKTTANDALKFTQAALNLASARERMPLEER